MRGVSFVRTRALVFLPSGSRGVARGSRFGLATRQPRRPQHPARREQQGRSARQLSDRARPESARARLGRAECAAAEPSGSSSASSSTTRAAGASTTSFYWKTFREQLQRRRPPRASVAGNGSARHPMGATGRCRSGRFSSPTSGFTPWTSGLRQWELHLSHWIGFARAARGLAGLGLQRPLSPPVWAVHVPRPARSTAFGSYPFRGADRRLRPPALPRYAQIRRRRPGWRRVELFRRAQSEGRLLLRLLQAQRRRRRLSRTRRGSRACVRRATGTCIG